MTSTRNSSSISQREHQDTGSNAPILDHKHYHAPSVFTPEQLLYGARRQKSLSPGQVPTVCILDPDGDLVDHLRATQRLRHHPTWACYHTKLGTFLHGGIEFGIVGRVVGAPFAVLVAEELFTCGCELVISISSAGQIISRGRPPYMVLIEKALRDEGTSYHYLPPSPYSILQPTLREMMCASWDHSIVPFQIGTSWTTDAPFRETEAMIAMCRDQGILTVEMEAAALYALASAKQKDLICFAYVTNQMGQAEDDFEKGIAQGAQAALHVINHTAHQWLRSSERTT